MNEIQQKCEKLLLLEGIDIDSEIDFAVNAEMHTLSFKYIIETFMLASDESQHLFFNALEKAIDTKEMGVERFFEGMGQLLLMTHLSQNIEI